LFNVGVFVFECIRETETDDGETRVVTFWIIMIEFGVVIGTDFVDVRETMIVCLVRREGKHGGRAGIHPVASRAMEMNLAFWRLCLWIAAYPSWPR
jgi:hypothetical protein